MKVNAPIVFHDASCALCNAEIGEIRKVAAPDSLQFVDCSATDFDTGRWLSEGVSRADMMDALHVRESGGTWHKGVDAFAVLYERAGLPMIAHFWAHPLAGKLMKRLYPWIARNRYRLSHFGLPALIAGMVRFSARRAARRSARCASGSCSL